MDITADFRAILSVAVGWFPEERSMKSILIAPSSAGRVAVAPAIAET